MESEDKIVGFRAKGMFLKAARRLQILERCHIRPSVVNLNPQKTRSARRYLGVPP